MQWNTQIYREYDIRGVYGKDYDEEFAKCLGAAFCLSLEMKLGRPPNVSLGYDARLSSPSLFQALTEGIQIMGGHVLDMGMITSPLSYFSCFHFPEVDGSIMVTGSHNPPEYNGFKMSYGKRTLHGLQIQDLKKRIENPLLWDTVSENPGTLCQLDVFEPYLNRYKKEFHFDNRIPVVVDCAHGAAGVICRELFETVGLDVTFINETPDGRFPAHHPDPTVAENMVQLADKVKEIGAFVGIGFDGDADRIGVVDENGKMLYADSLLAIYAEFILKKHPGAKIIGDVKCTQSFYDLVKQQGGVPIMWKTGHSLVKDKVRIEESPFGGELSGHIFFADRNYGYDDALYAALRLIEILESSKKKLSEVVNLPELFTTPEYRLDVDDDKKFELIEQLVTETKSNKPAFMDEVSYVDGIRIKAFGGWALARASNTQPAITIRLEAQSEDQLEELKQKFIHWIFESSGFNFVNKIQ